MRTIRNCNVAVIGGAGFLGSHLVQHLIEDRGCRVLVVDNLCAGRLEHVHPKAEFWHHDITGSEDAMRKRLVQFGAKHLFNYAAWPYIPDSFARPVQVSDVNYMGAIKCINAAQEAGCEGFLQVSSAEIYGCGMAFGDRVVPGDGKKGWAELHDSPMSLLVYDSRPIDERAPVLPHSTYGAAKAAVDYYCQCAWRERKTPCIALRQFNCVGERETHPYIVPEIISQLSKQQCKCQACQGSGVYHPNPDNLEKPCSACKGRGWFEEKQATIRLGNNSFRDFLYAGDQARIAVELLERGAFGEVYNLGSETGVKMYDLAKLIGKLMGFADVTVEEDASRKRPWEIWHLQSDNSKIKAVCKQKDDLRHDQISVLTPLEEALKRTIAWFNNNGHKWPWEK